MPYPLVGRTKLSHRIRYFFIWNLVAAHVTCSNSEWGYRGFLWTKGTPKYITRNRAALINISREQGNKPNFWGSESGNLENSFFSMHWPYAFVIVGNRSVSMLYWYSKGCWWAKTDSSRTYEYCNLCTEFAVRFVYVDTNNSVRSWRMGMLTIKIR